MKASVAKDAMYTISGALDELYECLGDNAEEAFQEINKAESTIIHFIREKEDEEVLPRNQQIREEIYKLINDRFYNTCSECVNPYDPTVDISLEEGISELFVKIGVLYFKTDFITCFSSPGYENGVVAVSWIGAEGLDMEVIDWEVM